MLSWLFTLDTDTKSDDQMLRKTGHERSMKDIKSDKMELNVIEYLKSWNASLFVVTVIITNINISYT